MIKDSIFDKITKIFPGGVPSYLAVAAAYPETLRIVIEASEEYQRQLISITDVLYDVDWEIVLADFADDQKYARCHRMRIQYRQRQLARRRRNRKK